MRLQLTPPALFELLLRAHGIVGYEAEYRFCQRRWRLDYAFLATESRLYDVALEIDEETAHGRWYKQTQDRQKHNAAVVLGWRLLRFSGAMLRDDPDLCIAQLKQLLSC